MHCSAFSSKLPGRKLGQFGFTLVELIVVMVVIGILGAVAAPKFFEQKGFSAVAYTDQVRSLLRYGQKIAIAQNRNVYVRLDGASVALCYNSACTLNVPSPGGANSGSSTTMLRCSNSSTWACEGVPSGLTITGASTFYFDPVGQPFLASDTPPTLASNFPAQLTVTVSGDGLNHDSIINAQTGYVAQ